MPCNLPAISIPNSPTNSSACTSTSAPSTTETMAAKPSAVCSTWATRQGSFRRRHGWSGCKDRYELRAASPELDAFYSYSGFVILAKRGICSLPAIDITKWVLFARSPRLVARSSLPHPLPKRKHRINIHRNVRSRLQRCLQLLRHRVVLLEPIFRAHPVSRRLDFEQFLG